MKMPTFLLLSMAYPHYQGILNAFSDAEYVSFGELLNILLLLTAIQIVGFKILLNAEMLKLKIARS